MVIGSVIAVALALLAQVAPTPALVPAARAEPAKPKAVVIVGPTNELTDSNLRDGEKIAANAEAAGMDVRRVFFPYATWDNVLANIQGANFVAYLGHGYGWPSPYTKDLTESRQNGMGLNSYPGSGKAKYTYYGANKLREYVRLAPNAVVYLNHLCYAAGNGEPGMAIPSDDIARQRVDNMANGWLAAGARAVFAFSWNQKLNFPGALMTSDQTMDQLFMTPARGAPNGWIGWRPLRFDSQRTPGAKNHLDPHKSYGFYRAVTGDLGMTAAEWRSGAPPATTPPAPEPDESNPADAPQITSLTAGTSGPAAPGTTVAGAGPAAFHPNGDGLDDELLVTHEVTEAAYLDVTITNSDGVAVRSYTFWSDQGAGTSRWNGRNDGGAYVPDGTYTVTYVPRDSDGNVGNAVTTDALVLTAIKLLKPSKAAFYASDADLLAKAVKFPVKLNQAAELTWSIVDAGGAQVRTVRSNHPVPASTQTFKWDGRADDGSWVPDGWYRSVVTARTAHGAYTQEREVYVGAFRITPSIESPARGDTVTLTIISSEPLSGAPSVSVNQPGVAAWSVSTKSITTKKYKAFVTLKSAGEAGTVDFVVSGTDKYGGRQATTLSLPLR